MLRPAEPGPVVTTWTAGPLTFALELDAALAGVGRRPGEVAAGESVLRVRLRAGGGFDASQRAAFGADGRLEAGSCRLQRTSDGVVGECDPSREALDRAVRFALQPALLRQGWLLLHGSSVLLDGAAHVFVAPSGTGKSTLARRLVAAGAVLLGDEVALVAAGKAAVFAFQPAAGTPAGLHPLAAIHLLGRGAPRSAPVSRARGVTGLLAQSLVYEQGSRAASEALAVASELGPVFATTVRDDAGAAALFGLRVAA